MADRDERIAYEEVVLPNLDSAYSLARWLVRRETDAEDVVQEACLRALRFFGTFHGGNGRSWLLRIVRNTAFTWLQRNRRHELEAPLGNRSPWRPPTRVPSS